MKALVGLLAVAGGLAVTVGFAAGAEARMHHPYRGHRITAQAATSPPLDGMTNPSGAYGFRKLRTAYAGPAVRIRRASDNAETDINFLTFTSFTGAPWDEAAAVAHCAATSCFIRTWYDQSGNARDWGHATAANQVPLVLGCQNSLACLEMTATAHQASGASFTPATGLVTMSVVGNRVSGTGTCTFLRENGNVNRLTPAGTANNWGIFPTGLTAAAADNTWHAAAGVLSPTAGQSVLSIDGTETTGTTIPTTAAGVPGIVGSGTAVCRQTEAIFWDNYSMPVGERAALVANQRSFWVP